MKCRICGSYAINPHQHRRNDSDLDLCDVCYWRTRAEEAYRQVHQKKEEVWMADACLDQMRQWLAAHGIDVKHTPPMYYPEACQSVLARLVEKQQADDEIKLVEAIDKAGEDYEHMVGECECLKRMVSEFQKRMPAEEIVEAIGSDCFA